MSRFWMGKFNRHKRHNPQFCHVTPKKSLLAWGMEMGKRRRSENEKMRKERNGLDFQFIKSGLF